MTCRTILVFVLFVFSLQVAQAQNTCQLTLTGNVLDEDLNQLPGATVRFLHNSRGIATGLDGGFAFKDICPGSYTIVTSFIGHSIDTIQVNVTTNEVIRIVLKGNELVLTGVEVSAEKEGGMSESSTLNAEALARVQGQPLGETLKSLLGVTTLNTGPGIVKPVIHGLHSNRVLIFNNGIRQEGQQWGSEHAPEIDPFIASEIRVVKGAEAVRYGSDAIGGLILVEPPALHKTEYFGGDINLSGMSNGRMGLASGLIEGPLKAVKGLAWRLQGTIKKAGDSHAPEYMLTNTGIGEVNFSGGVSYGNKKRGVEVFYSRFNTKLGILRSAHIGNLSDLETAITSSMPTIIEDFSYTILNPRQEVNHDLVKLTGFTETDEHTRWELIYGGQLNRRQEYDIRRGSYSDVPALDLTLMSHSLDLFREKKRDTQINSLGMTTVFQINRWDPNTGKDPLIPWFNQLTTGAFWIRKWVHATYESELGMRLDYKDLLVKAFNRANQLVVQPYQFFNGSVTGGVQYALSENFSFRSQLGTAWRPPHVSELFSNGVHHGTASYEKGLLINEDEDIYADISTRKVYPEYAGKWTNSLRYSKSIFSIEGLLYQHLINNFIYLMPLPGETILTSRGAFPVFQYRQTDTWLRGVDGSLGIDVTRNLHYLMKASVIRATHRTTGEGIVMIPPGQLENTLQLEIEGGEKISDFHLSVGSLLVGKQLRVAEDTDFAPIPEGYFLLNMHTGITLPVNHNFLNFYLNVDNILNTSYRSYMNRLRYFSDEVGRNVTLRLKYDFHNH
ncbi:MAG: TonB-dependent receptor [Cyclobacteriaceae bacterium]|nr:TonB-dependent receptor [Cyclobacteriaceae bacterium]